MALFGIAMTVAILIFILQDSLSMRIATIKKALENHFVDVVASFQTWLVGQPLHA